MDPDRVKLFIFSLGCISYWGILGPFMVKFAVLNIYAKATVVFLTVIGVMATAVFVSLASATYLMRYMCFSSNSDCFSQFLSGNKQVKTVPREKMYTMLDANSQRDSSFLWSGVGNHMVLQKGQPRSPLFHHPDLLHFLLILTPDPVITLNKLMKKHIALDCSTGQAQGRSRHGSTASQPCQMCAQTLCLLQEFSITVNKRDVSITPHVPSLKDAARSSIRKSLKTNTWHGCSQLPLPKELQLYLMYNYASLDELYCDSVGAYFHILKKRLKRRHDSESTCSTIITIPEDEESSSQQSTLTTPLVSQSSV